MNIIENISELKAVIGYNNNPEIRSILNDPYDFKRAVEYGIRTLCKKAKISLKSVFIPFISNSQFMLASLESAGANGFEIVAPKAIYILSSDGSITEIVEEELEDVVTDTYNMDLAIYRIALRRIGTGLRVQSNLEVGTQPVVGTYSSILTTTANQIVLPSGTSTIGYYVINLSKASESKYSYAKITNVATVTLTLDQTIATNPNYLWTALDKIYLVSSLPYLFTLIFQGLPKKNYFDTYTTIPIEDVYLDYIEPIAMEYLYNIIRGRIPQHNQTYITQKTLSKEAIRDAKIVANKRTAFMKVKPFNIYTPDYGR